MIEPLTNNGGPTQTHALMPTSAAVDTGDVGICAAPQVDNLDQRSESRPVDGNGDGISICDIGSYEQQESVPVCNGLLASIFVGPDGIIVGGPKDGRTYKGLLVGTSANDVILGTPLDDRIIGLNGDDTICGGHGDDKLRGNNGDDTMVGGDDSDNFKGGGGIDTVVDFQPFEDDVTINVENL